MTRRRARLALSVIAGVAAVALPVAAGAQIEQQVPTLPPLVPTTTTTTPSATTTTTTPASTTTRPPLVSLPGGSPTTTTTTTTAPPPTDAAPGPVAGPVAPSPAGPPAPADPGGGGGEGAAGAQGGPFLIPPGYQAIINSVVRTRANNTGRLLDALRPLEDFGLTPQEAAIIGFGRFPVAGYSGYSHDWLFPRAGPPFHLHQGTDIFAAEGTPIRAPFDGIVRISTGGRLGGNAVYVTAQDGTYVYNAHLSAFPDGLVTGASVKLGDVIGFVGRTGNAVTTPPHDHFEIHPGGGAAVDPKQYLDRWIEEALANVPALIERFRASQPRILAATGITRRLATGDSGVFAAPTRPSRAQLLWASSMSPAGGALNLAEAEAVEAAESVDWQRRARTEVARAVAWEQAATRARTLLTPLTPAPLARVLG